MEVLPASRPSIRMRACVPPRLEIDSQREVNFELSNPICVSANFSLFSNSFSVIL